MPRASKPQTQSKAMRSKSPESKAASDSDSIDKQLAHYQSMRDFAITSEPRGGSHKPDKSAAKGLPFIIQKHAASHLHYDIRLGWAGVLKSWACAKGPSYYPGDRRLAVQVEDHPIEYGGFEGIIPAGQYGGGTVMLWDQGTWEPQSGHTDIDAGLRDGSLKFTMYGSKMHGNWTMVRMGGKASHEKKPNWLLIKEHDAFERSETDTPVTEEAPNSVVTHRSLKEIADSQDHIWNSKDTARGQAWQRQDSSRKSHTTTSLPKAKSPGKRTAIEITRSLTFDLTAAPTEALPSFIAPQLATQALTAPTNQGWLSELKLDGYRIQCHLADGRVELRTRTGLDWTGRMRPLAAELAKLPASAALLDGEVVVLSEDGNTSFSALQASFQGPTRTVLTYFLFDILHLNGHNLRPLPLLQRKHILAELCSASDDSIRLSEHLESDAGAMFHKACELHAEGIIAKRADAAYNSGRSSTWLKLKCVHEQEFVVAGFTLPSKGHKDMHGIGSLLLGYYTDERKLIYAGRTGTGFTHETHSDLRTRLNVLRQHSTPFVDPPAEARKQAIWVKPMLVAQVRFATWTAENLLRQASFQGLREDKPAAEVRREEPRMRPRTQPVTIPAKKINPTMEKAADPIPHAPVRLTHPEKILDPESHLTKQQLADYYWAIAPHLLPHIEGRPLSLVRCPEGTGLPCFFQKHTSTMLPPGIDSVDVPDKKTGKPEPYITLSTPEALTSLAQMGVLELHPWGSRNDDLEHPDRIIIDLDPDLTVPWETLASAAAEVRKRLKKIGIEAFLKSTGGKGLHIVAPIEPQHEWATLKRFAHAFVLSLERSNTELYLTKMTKSARVGKIYLDYLRNERGATAVALFSPRARAGAPVSFPLRWSDLKSAERPHFTIGDYKTWAARLTPDPWKRFFRTNQHLSDAALASYAVQP